MIRTILSEGLQSMGLNCLGDSTVRLVILEPQFQLKIEKEIEIEIEKFSF